jgi:hypothetical protein
VNAGGTRAGWVTRRRRAVLATLIAAALATGLAGCSLRGADPATTTRPVSADPGSSARAGSSAAVSGSARARSSVAAMVARADRTHEVPTPPGREPVAGGWRSPTQAVYVFAMQYINWNAQDVSARLRALARVSVGQARSAASAAASETASDDELKQGQIANVGVVEAIAPVLGHRYEYAVATRERTTAAATDAYQGIAPAWHLALATVTRLAGGLWVLSNWQPEN